jgi:hypothetical protein
MKHESFFISLNQPTKGWFHLLSYRFELGGNKRYDLPIQDQGSEFPAHDAQIPDLDVPLPSQTAKDDRIPQCFALATRLVTAGVYDRHKVECNESFASKASEWTRAMNMCVSWVCLQLSKRIQ